MKQNFKLTKDQQTLVEKNLSIVHWVIVNNIHVNPGICGLEYGDLFQEGCLWLCKAAFTYHAGQAQFSTYAKKVVKNGLLSYCRKICSQGRHVSRLIIGEQGELAADGEQVDQPDDHFDSHLSRLETLDLLEASKQNYQGGCQTWHRSTGAEGSGNAHYRHRRPLSSPSFPCGRLDLPLPGKTSQ